MNERYVLLIEDDPGDRALASAELKDWAAEVVEAKDGPEGLRAISEWRNADSARPWPSLVLLDVGLPGMGGLDVLRRIRETEEAQRVPVVMFSSSALPEVIRAAYDGGANGYVIKPSDAEQFRQTVVSTAAFWLRWNHPPG